MTIKEAINHAKEVAEKKYAEGMLCNAKSKDNASNSCIKCAKAHEQLAECLEELQQYREIGTVERFQQLAGQFNPHVTDKTSCPERHCNKCDKYRKENEKYHAIGTVEECREARERQRAKKRKLDSYCGFNSYECPVCGAEPVSGSNYCHKCGQRLE